jgi:hypothetical protein
MRFIRASTGVVEQYAGSVVRRTWTETRDSPAGSRLLLSHPPVLSVTSVAESGTTLTGDAYKVNKAAGVLTRVAGDLEYPWLDGVQNIDVVYVAGRTAVEGHWQRAALIIVAHMWETQLGPVRELIDTRDDEFDARQLYSIPRRALELLGEPIGGIA